MLTAASAQPHCTAVFPHCFSVVVSWTPGPGPGPSASWTLSPRLPVPPLGARSVEPLWTLVFSPSHRIHPFVPRGSSLVPRQTNLAGPPGVLIRLFLHVRSLLDSPKSARAPVFPLPAASNEIGPTQKNVAISNAVRIAPRTHFPPFSLFSLTTSNHRLLQRPHCFSSRPNVPRARASSNFTILQRRTSRIASTGLIASRCPRPPDFPSFSPRASPRSQHTSPSEGIPDRAPLVFVNAGHADARAFFPPSPIQLPAFYFHWIRPIAPAQPAFSVSSLRPFPAGQQGLPLVDDAPVLHRRQSSCNSISAPHPRCLRRPPPCLNQPRPPAFSTRGGPVSKWTRL